MYAIQGVSFIDHLLVLCGQTNVCMRSYSEFILFIDNIWVFPAINIPWLKTYTL